MAITTAQVAVSTTAAELTGGAGAVAAAGTKLKIKVTAPAAADLFVGLAGVLSSTGYRIKADTSQEFIMEKGERLFGILASGTGTAYVYRSLF